MTTKTVFSENRWEIRIPAVKDGMLKLRFQYESGRAAAEIQNVSLRVGDKVIAQDNHLAWTGAVTRENIYSFKIPAEYAGKTLTLVASIRGADGNTDSTGAVFIEP